MEVIGDFTTSGGTTSAGTTSTESIFDLYAFEESEDNSGYHYKQREFKLCEKPRNMPIELYKVYKLIMVTIPKIVDELRQTEVFIKCNRDLEVSDIPEHLIDLIARVSEFNVGELYYNSSKRFSNENLYDNTITIKELFLMIIIELKISFKLAVSKHYLERIIYNSPGDGINVCEQSTKEIQEISEVRLSKLIKHRFVGEVYSLSNNNCNKVQMTIQNYGYFFMVGVMCKFLSRKNSLYIDYVDFFDKEGEESVIKPLDIKNNFHLSKGGIFYYNIWKGSEKYNDKNNIKRNSLVCILCFVKFKMNSI